MTFIVVLVTLLVERFFDWSHLRNWSWYNQVQQLVMEKLPGMSPFVILAAVVAPMVLLLTLVSYLLHNVLYGFPWLVFQVFVLLYCLGARNLWADSFSTITSVTQDDAHTAGIRLNDAFGVSANESSTALHHQLLNQIFIAANSRVFAVIFWYGVLGIAGALLYRLVVVAATSKNANGTEAVPEINNAAQLVQSWLDWIPARIITFLFALGGNYMKVFNSWRKNVILGPEANDMLLSECGEAAVMEDTDNVPDDGSVERSAVSLLDRVFIFVLIASGVLVFVF